jgi:hypothetical protein
MPSRRRPKAPPPRPLTDVERFAQSVRDHEESDRRAKQAEIDRKAEKERRRLEAIEQAARLERAQAAHQRAVDQVKEAQRTGKGAAAADLAWREAKAELIELETGTRPTWAPRPPEPAEASTDDAMGPETTTLSPQDVDGASDDQRDSGE